MLLFNSFFLPPVPPQRSRDKEQSCLCDDVIRIAMYKILFKIFDTLKQKNLELGKKYYPFKQYLMQRSPEKKMSYRRFCSTSQDGCGKIGKNMNQIKI
jgi:hypothetical protein